jgi:low temperature requirement protein LtrA
VIGASADPGRLGRSAYHLVHPIMIAGIIALAVADQLVLQHPFRDRPAAAWTVLGGTALFIGGHALFKATIWRVWPWPRLAAVVVLLVLLPFGSQLSPLVLALCALAVTVGVIVADVVHFRRPV